jgi:hypothetical protein
VANPGAESRSVNGEEGGIVANTVSTDREIRAKVTAMMERISSLRF